MSQTGCCIQNQLFLNIEIYFKTPIYTKYKSIFVMFCYLSQAHTDRHRTDGTHRTGRIIFGVCAHWFASYGQDGSDFLRTLSTLDHSPSFCRQMPQSPSTSFVRIGLNALSGINFGIADVRCGQIVALTFEIM